MLQERKVYCLQARPCIFQPGNFTGWGSEGVNETLKWLSSLPTRCRSHSGGDSVAIGLSLSLSTISLLPPLPVPTKPYQVSVDVKQHVYLL